MRLLLFSTSTLHGGGFLEYALPYLQEFLPADARVLFVPWARPSGIAPERYTERVRWALAPVGFAVDGIEAATDPVDAVERAAAIFVGGGNTFVLLRALYEHRLLEPIRRRVHAGVPYVGSSAGSNVAGVSIGTTNDMPIVHPPSFEAFGLVPFNVNPHYLDPDPDSRHMGETRETRIREFHVFNRQPVIGLREGSLLRREGNALTLEGTRGARLFRRGAEPTEHAPGEHLDFLLDSVREEEPND